MSRDSNFDRPDFRWLLRPRDEVAGDQGDTGLGAPDDVFIHSVFLPPTKRHPGRHRIRYQSGTVDRIAIAFTSTAVGAVYSAAKPEDEIDSSRTIWADDRR